jgi:hypothetical protein
MSKTCARLYKYFYNIVSRWYSRSHSLHVTEIVLSNRFTEEDTDSGRIVVD